MTGYDYQVHLIASVNKEIYHHTNHQKQIKSKKFEKEIIELKKKSSLKTI